MCPLFRGGSLVDNKYSSLAFVSIQPDFVFCLGQPICLFNPFTLKVIIDKYDSAAIYFIVLGSGLYSFFVFPV